MGVAHLEGKRSGRRRGSKSRPYWQRAVQWVERHLDDEVARPPSPLARLLQALARERPDLFVTMLATLEQRLGSRERPQQSAMPVIRYDRAYSAAAFVVPKSWVNSLVEFSDEALEVLPDDARLMEAATTPDRQDMLIVITAPSLPLVPAGTPIPVRRCPPGESTGRQ